MSTEEQTVASLRESVPSPDEPQTKPETPTPPEGTPASATAGVQLDDVMHYKLFEYFGQQYRSTDEQGKERIGFIYNSIAQQIGTTDYSFVVTQIRNIEQMLGTGHADNRIYRVYEWIRLNGIRRKIDMEMEAVRA